MRRGRSVGATSVTGLVYCARLLVVKSSLTAMQFEKTQELGLLPHIYPVFYLNITMNKCLDHISMLDFPFAVDSI